MLWLFRALGTPNNEVWPEVESLQDYKNTFPKWKPGSLASHVKNLDENGLDLLSVRNALNSDLNIIILNVLSSFFYLANRKTTNIY